jgi:hypothetical protein
MLVQNITSVLLLHIILSSCSLSTRSCLVEIFRIICYLTWSTLQRTSHIKIMMHPIIRTLFKMCLPAEHELRMQFTDNLITFSTPCRLHVACNSPLLSTNGLNYVTLQVNVKNVRLNCINLPETIWVRIFSYYMPKKVSIGNLEYDLQLVKISKRTMQFKLCGDVSKWVGNQQMSAYVRFNKTAFELYLIPNIHQLH